MGAKPGQKTGNTEKSQAVAKMALFSSNLTEKAETGILPMILRNCGFSAF
jgi:hypothetical protein